MIGQCLASLERQSHPPDDVVVSDGGSTDETAAIANAHGAKVVLGAANRSAQRNAGAERALGEYVVFVDSDMQLTPAVLEDSLTTFRESDAALVIPEVFVGENYWPGSGASSAPSTMTSGGCRRPGATGEPSSSRSVVSTRA